MARSGSPTRNRFLVVIGALASLVGGAALVIPTPTLAEEPQSKLERQINVTQRLLDEMLVDSPNFLVSGHEVTEGVEIEEYGAFFTFRASLTGWGWEPGRFGRSLDFWPFNGGKRNVVVIKGDKDKGEKEISIGDGSIVIKDGEVYMKEGGKTRKLSGKDGADVVDEKQYRADQLKKYEAAKDELIRFMLDYGETLKALPAGQSVRIVARMTDLDLPEGHEVRSLTLKASIDDLRAYGDGRLSEGAARAKITVKES
jgi:hypothetical protein